MSIVKKPKRDPLTCKTCGLTKTREDFSVKKDGSLLCYCKNCVCIRSRAAYQKNKKRHNALTRAYAVKNKEAVAAYQSQYYKDNQKKIIEYQLRYAKEKPEKSANTKRRFRNKARTELTDSGIKTMLRKEYGLKAADVTPELIELKRKKIQSWRTLQTLKKSSQNQSN